jgi:3-oxoadipate enol-lactonase
LKAALSEAVTRDGIDISYTRTPAQPGAPRVVYIHSLALDRSIWDDVVDRLTGRADQVALDCRGHGRSGRAGMPYSVEQLADDVADLLDHLGWPSTTVVGCSMGGCVAQAFAARHPDRTDAAAFIDTTAWYGPSAAEDWAARARSAHERGLTALVPFQLERWFGDQFRSTRGDLMAALSTVFTANDHDSYDATCAMLGSADLRASAQLVACTSVVIVGEDDQATPPAMARDLADRIHGSRLVVVTGTRHLTPLENPTVVVESLLSLWDGINGASK